jgi:predicted dehydrogenase
MLHKVIVAGIGGMGRYWCDQCLPSNIRDGYVEVAAVVDPNPDAVAYAQRSLGLRADQCYVDVQKAFDEVRADVCIVITPPSVHEPIVDLALDHDMHILSEKPIADTLAGSVRIAQKVAAAGKKMGVTMSHRFDQDKSTLRHELRSGKYGQLDYIVCRFTCDNRKYGAWGRFRHDIPDALMVEGSVHHLDILADLADAKADTLYAQTWNPSWGEFAGDSQGLVMLHFDNGSRAFYEGAKTNAVGLNCWGREYLRAECEKATLVLSHRQLERFDHGAAPATTGPLEGRGTPIPLLQQPKWANTWLIEKFVKWLDGGEAMETNVEDNLQSVALIFAAIESSRSGRPVQVQELLAHERAQAAR